jgi:hypothetical protein
MTLGFAHKPKVREAPKEEVQISAASFIAIILLLYHLLL